MSAKYRVIIIDDEELGRKVIKKYLSEFPQFEIVGEAANGFTGIKLIQESKPDLAFLDIQMPKLTGFELLELVDEPMNVIFATAYDQFAVQAFEMNAVDYLLKPFSPERFKQAIDKFLSQSQKSQSENLDKLKSFVESEKKVIDRFPIRDGAKIIILNLDDIQYFEAQDDYVLVRTTTTKYLKKQTMKSLEEKLPPTNFVRIHRSYIVNLDFFKEIEIYDKESYRLRLTTGMVLEVSKSGYQNIKSIIS